ncbi:MAG: hypothetical protein ACOX0F_13110 [Syntrophomonadaceae bacterium]|jgi:hypothetical protein
MGGIFKQIAGGTMCKLEINFFDQKRAGVGITAYLFDVRELDVIRFFSMFLSKILFTLGQCSTSSALLLNVYDYFCAMANNRLEDGRVPRVNVLEKDQLLTDSDETPQRIYRSQFYGTNDLDRDIDISMPLGEENYYAPAAVMFFLQYLLLNLSDKGVQMMVVYMKHVLDYYLHIGEYSKLRAGSEADQYALNMMLTVDGGSDHGQGMM